MQYKVLSFRQIPCFKPPRLFGVGFGREVALALQGQRVAFPRGMGGDFVGESSKVAGDSEEVLTSLVVGADFLERAHETACIMEKEVLDPILKVAPLGSDVAEMISGILLGTPQIKVFYDTLDVHKDYWLKVLVNWMTIQLCQSSVQRQMYELEDAFVSFADAVDTAYANYDLDYDLDQRQADLKQALFALEQDLARLPEASRTPIAELSINRFDLTAEARPVEAGADIISELEPEEPDVVRVYTVSGSPVVGLDDMSAFRQEVLPTKIGLYHKEITAALVFAVECLGYLAFHEAAQKAGITSSYSYFRPEMPESIAAQPAPVDWLSWYKMLQAQEQQAAEQNRAQAAQARFLSGVPRMRTGRALGDLAPISQVGVPGALQTV
jgi:hypothetical protein